MEFYTKVYLKPLAAEGVILNAAVSQYKTMVAAQIEQLLVAWMATLYQHGQTVVDFKMELNNALPGVFQHMPSDDNMAKYLETQFNLDLATSQSLGFRMKARMHDFALYEAIEVLSGPLNTYIHSLGKTPLTYAKFVTASQASELEQFIDLQVAQNAYLHDTFKVNKLAELNKKVFTDYQSLIRYIGRQPLFTAGYLFTFGKGSLLSSHVAGINFLCGTGGWQTLKTGQITASLTDTLNSGDATGVTRNLDRNIIAFQAGYNQVLAMQKKASVMEISGAFEFDRATSGYISKSDKNKFYFDAYFRARLPSSPWLKFDFKWDPKDGNVFGFLNFTYNLDKP